MSYGEEIFSEQCGACHGDFAEGVDRWPELAGGEGTLADDDPLKTVGSMAISLNCMGLYSQVYAIWLCTKFKRR